jgi:hypothetical protein
MSIQIEDDELPAMMAVLVQGKFCPEPEDEAVAASPIVARIARRLGDAAIKSQISRFGESMAAHHERWRDFAEHRAEWSFAVSHARKFFAPAWHAWSPERQIEVIDDLVAPFSMGAATREVFVEAFLAPDGTD